MIIRIFNAIPENPSGVITPCLVKRVRNAYDCKIARGTVRILEYCANFFLPASPSSLVHGLEFWKNDCQKLHDN